MRSAARALARALAPAAVGGPRRAPPRALAVAALRGCARPLSTNPSGSDQRIGTAFGHLDGASVRGDIRDAFDAFYAHVASSGEWFTAEQRLAIAAETRRVFNIGGGPSADFDVSKVRAGPGCGCLPFALIQQIHQICYAPGAIDRNFYEMITSTLEPAEYVEALSITCHTIAIETFHLGVGMRSPALPSASADAGVPARQLSQPNETKVQIAMVPTVALADAKGKLKELWQRAFVAHNVKPFHVQQALSAVHTEQLMFARTFDSLYIPQAKVGGDPGWSRPGELIRFADAIHRRDAAGVAAAREALLAAFGGNTQKFVDSVAVVSFFNGIADRIADATGLRVESFRVDASVQYALGDTNVLASSSSPVTQGLLSPTSLTVAGFASCPFHRQALAAARDLVARGIVVDLVDKTFPARDAYREWLFSESGRSACAGEQAQQHTSSPFVFADDRQYIGGCDALVSLASMLVAGGASASTTTGGGGGARARL
eukprot:g1206.t1